MNRSKLEIARDILKVSDSENGAKKSWMIRRGNLSSKQAKYYLPLLESRGFLKSETNNGEDIRYRTSGEGKEFLEYMKDITI